LNELDQIEDQILSTKKEIKKISTEMDNVKNKVKLEKTENLKIELEMVLKKVTFMLTHQEI
jgi:hypothetical protein